MHKNTIMSSAGNLLKLIQKLKRMPLPADHGGDHPAGIGIALLSGRKQAG